MKLLRHLAAMALAIIVAACGGSGPDSPITTPGSSRVALWEVADASGPRAWIFGTVHALPPGTAWQRPEIGEALTRADRLVLEIGEEISPDIAGRALRSRAVTPGLPAASARIDPAYRADLLKSYERLGLRDQSFPDLETWAIALQIAAIAGEKNDVRAADGVEPELRRLAKGKPIVGLETIAGQFAMFDTLPEAQQKTLLEQTVSEIASPQDEERQLLDLWLKGDDLGISREAAKGFLADNTLRAVLLTDRNTAWVKQVEAMLKDGAQPFIAVGAAHVSGSDGLPALLAARGWTVKRLP
jgi:uncharacterized protein YbaP (TraB family)